MPSKRLFARYASDVFREYEHRGTSWQEQDNVTVRFTDSFDEPSERIPEFGAAMPSSIRHWDETVKKRNLPHVKLTTFADALYAAFRCGILHEAHVAAYGMVRGRNLVDQIPSGFTKYHDGTDCPTVTIDPWKLLEKVKGVLDAYINQLKNRDSNDDLRKRFKAKFTESFGVDITGVA